MNVLRRYSRCHKLLESSQKICAAKGPSGGRRRPGLRTGAGFIHKLNQRPEPAVVAHIVAEYESGTPTTELASHFGLSKAAVLKLLHEAGVTMRRQPLAEDELALARKLYESGLSLIEVGKQLRRHHTTVHLALRRAGVVMRPRKGGPKRRR